MLSFRRDTVILPRFDAPSGFQQCQTNDNPTYPLSYGGDTCYKDGGELKTVYLGD